MEEFSISLKTSPEAVDDVVDRIKAIGCRMKRIELSEVGIKIVVACPKSKLNELTSALYEYLS